MNLDLTKSTYVVFDSVNMTMKYYQNGEEFNCPCFKLKFQGPKSEIEFVNWPGHKNERALRWNEANPEKDHKTAKPKTWAYRWINSRFEKDRWYTVTNRSGDVYEIYAEKAIEYEVDGKWLVDLRGSTIHDCKFNGKALKPHNLATEWSVKCSSKCHIRESIFVKKERFRDVEEFSGYKIGDVIHIKRYYHEEGSEDFKNAIQNSVMVDAKVSIDRITIDDNTGKDTLWCGKFSTSSTDIANKGIVK